MDKPTIDEQILQNQLAEADRRATERDAYKRKWGEAIDGILAVGTRLQSAERQLAELQALLKNNIERIERYGFECEAGSLKNCAEWVELKGGEK